MREYYVTVNVAKKSGKQTKKQQSETVANTADPTFEFDFDLGDVRKGLEVEFAVFQKEGEESLPVAYGLKKVKDIEPDVESPIEIPLGEPPFDRFPKIPWTFTAYGTLVVVLTQSLKQQ